MKWLVRRTAIENLTSSSTPPYFDFAEDARSSGTGYALGDDGHFIVGTSRSALPGFIVDLKLPRNMHAGRYRLLLPILREYSVGRLWFDTSHIDTYDVVWRLGLRIKAAAPLFAWKDDAKDCLQEAGYEASKVESSGDVGIAEQLSRTYLQSDLERSGLAAALETRNAYLLRNSRRTLGVAILREQGAGFAACTLILLPECRNVDLGMWFGVAVARYERLRARQLVTTISNEHPGSLRGCIRLGLTPIKHSFTAVLDEYTHPALKNLSVAPKDVTVAREG